MNRLRLSVLVLLAALSCMLGVHPVHAALAPRSADPYVGAIVIDAKSGAVLLEDKPDTAAYPASAIKLLPLLMILEYAKAGSLRFDEEVTVSAEAASMGGSQVYLKEKEVFTIDELLYALMVQSANDAAVALAVHVAGTKSRFVQLMNQRAAKLGMDNTTFHSVHGLPPGSGQEPDVSTARDISLLSRELIKHRRALRYTSTKERGFRNDTFIMRNHNRLLGEVRGVDGLKTGYFRAAGYSCSVTADRDGRRVIAVILGSRSRTGRDAKTRELLAAGFLALPAQPPVPQPDAAEQGTATDEEKAKEEPKGPQRPYAFWIGGGVFALLVVAVVGWIVSRSRLGGRFDVS
ncbi:MAG: D-alanyl-D-alanine carboxypeptidase [Lentisphaerae bacterium]|nr:D-alanyl-D-alanine carboxypeptidase [Lentisphaerota bacterium]